MRAGPGLRSEPLTLYQHGAGGFLSISGQSGFDIARPIEMVFARIEEGYSVRNVFYRRTLSSIMRGLIVKSLTLRSRRDTQPRRTLFISGARLFIDRLR